MTTSSREAWIAAAVDELRKNDSWAGRIHVHKLLYLVQEAKLAKPPFEFTLYQYGPYSFGLDEDIAQMELYGSLHKTYPASGYGPKYTLGHSGYEEANELNEEERKAISEVAEKIGDNDSQWLELRATCLWVERRECVNGDNAIVARVKKVKPRFSETEIREGLVEARDLLSSICTGRD